MKKNTFLPFLIVIFFLACNNTSKKAATPISNISTDFSISEKLEFNLYNTYDIKGEGLCVLDDSVLWYIEEGRQDFGSCYGLSTGKKLSTIVTKGVGINELEKLAGFKLIGDSVLFYTGSNVMKTFAKKDIVNNIPVEKRKVSVTTIPNDIFVGSMTKSPNGMVLATIRSFLYESEKKDLNELNEKSVVVFNHGKAKAYETINYDSYDIKKAKGKQIKADELIKWSYAQGAIEANSKDMAVFSVHNQFILYTFDPATGNVVNEKRYTNLSYDGGEMSFTSTNDMLLKINSMKVDNKYILCQVHGYLSQEDKEVELTQEAIFVFDWNLRPIKKFELPEMEEKYGYYTISNDCKSVYFCEYGEGITLYKADLNL